MEDLQSLPFKVGDRVETRSFLTGFRGAWFPCEIKKADRKRVALEYYNFPEDDIRWMSSIYHKAPHKPKGAKKELMLRPRFPPVYRQGEAPDVNTLSEVIVVTNGVWKVGDLADWYCDGCYWSGTIIDLQGDDKVKFKLHPKPIGEGLSYEALCKDLRPSLEWSQESGWTLPVPKGSSSYCPCARLIQPINQGKLESKQKKHNEAAQESPKDSKAAQESPSELNASASRSSVHSLPSSHGVKAREKVPENQTGVVPQDARCTRGEKRDADALESGVEKRSNSDSVSSTYVEASAQVLDKTLCKEHAPANEALTRAKLSKNTPLNSTCDSMLTLLVDLEELLTRVKWLRRFMEPPESEKAMWKFQEYRVGSSSNTVHK